MLTARLHRLVNKIIASLSACGGSMYDPNMDFCCGTNLYSSGDYRGCCGNDPLPKDNNTRCCGSVIFPVLDDWDVYRDCCNGEDIYFLETDVCCPDTGVEPRDGGGCGKCVWKIHIQVFVCFVPTSHLALLYQSCMFGTVRCDKAASQSAVAEG